MRPPRSLVSTSLAALAAFSLFLSQPGRSEEAAGSAPEETKKSAPNFTLKDLDEKPVALYDLLEKGPVLVSFWATWCKPCLQEMPHLSDLAKTFETNGLTTVAISIDEPRNKSRVRTHVQSKDYAFRTLLDPNQEAYRKLQGQSVPYVLLLDQQGHAAYVKVGYRPGDEATLEAAVRDLLHLPEGNTKEAVIE